MVTPFVNSKHVLRTKFVKSNPVDMQAFEGRGKTNFNPQTCDKSLS